MNTPLAGSFKLLSLSLLMHFAGWGLLAEARGGDVYELSPPERQLHQAKIAFQVQGKLHLEGPDKKKRQVPIEVNGDFLYDEYIASPTASLAARRYHTAEAEIKLEKNTHAPRLSDERRLVGVETQGAKSRFWSPGGPLLRDEVELIELQANSARLSALLPETPVSVGDTWTPADEALAAFLCIDTVNNNGVTCKLAEVKDGRAVVEMTGKASGAADSVLTEIEISAKYGYQVAEQRFTSLAMAMKEKRAIGQAEPGFEVTGRLTMLLTPLAASEHLTTEAVASIARGASAVSPLRYESTEKGLRLLLEPRWRVVIDRPEVTVFRFVDDGETVAQCNLSALEALPEGRKLQLEEFQEEIKKALGENFVQFIGASQGISESGLRVLRVSVTGQASELGIHWIYYHISNDEGRRVSFVITMEAEKANRFGAADSLFASSMELFAPTTAPGQKPTPAAKEARAASRRAQ